MRKQIITLALIAISFVSCTRSDKRQDKDSNDCGCHAKENALDLNGTTETNADVLTGPTAKL